MLRPFSVPTLNRLETAADLESAFREWNEQLYRYVCARVGSREVAEDIVQEAFIKAWTHRETFDAQKSSLKNWLFVITINTTRDYFRAKKQIVEPLEENIPAPEALADEFATKDLIKSIFARMKDLPERDHELLLLRYTEGLDVREIAAVLKLNYSAAKVALHRALQKLKDLCRDIPA